ncbi:EutP/PduV family microcompartment system protein [Konateibacter massiliensis]|uniref:EutP/PduV family microcompartment system protein n=1 Tax=Konateibacter massiliensis TaxID=2002841 RepID=UPI000C15F8F6|nr:EutP/PduV family microcompartment system protein [Konateibacter massiliensis]
MKKIILMGRSECGKTTLRQALKGDTLHYHKTQYVNHYDVVIDTPGEYAENHTLGRALALYSYEADVVGLLISATESYSLFPPCVTAVSTRPVIGIVTQIDEENGNPEQAEEWLRLAGCETVFFVSSYTGEGIWQIIDYLKEDGDVLPWKEDTAEQPRTVLSTKN